MPLPQIRVSDLVVLVAGQPTSNSIQVTQHCTFLSSVACLVCCCCCWVDLSVAAVIQIKGSFGALLLNVFSGVQQPRHDRSPNLQEMPTICNFGHSLNLFAVRVQIIATTDDRSTSSSSYSSCWSKSRAHDVVVVDGRWVHRTVIINERGRSYFQLSDSVKTREINFF